MRLQLFFACLVVAPFCSCSNKAGIDPNVKNATLQFWNAMATAMEEEAVKLKGVGEDYDGGMLVCDVYDAIGNRINRLPTKDVDPELVETAYDLAKTYRDLSAVFRRIVEQNRSWSYGISKIYNSAVESFVFGLSLGTVGDPSKSISDELDRFYGDNEKLGQTKMHLSKTLEELSSLRARLTARYGQEFPPLF